jgi:hypothetical protein
VGIYLCGGEWTHSHWPAVIGVNQVIPGCDPMTCILSTLRVQNEAETESYVLK